MKFIGMILLFSSFSFSGYFFGNRYLNALKEIERAELLVKNIIFCLKKENMTIYKIFENCSSESDEQTKNFIHSLSPKEFCKIKTLSEESGFCKNKEANKILYEVFSVLGKYSSSEQIFELEFCRKKLLNLYEKSEESFLSKAKLFRNLGVLSGAFFVIIFI